MSVNTNQVNLLEKIWRDTNRASSSAQNEAQRRNRNGNKTGNSSSPLSPTIPNGKSPKKTRSSAPRPKKKPPKTSPIKNKARKRGSGRSSVSKGRSYKTNKSPNSNAGKPPTSANTSSFNAGLKGSKSSALTTAASAASITKAGSGSLSGSLAGGGFFAGANTIPALALIAGNLVIWERNIESLKNIYNPASPQPVLFYPPTDRIIESGNKSQFYGGQDPQSTYSVSYTVRYKNVFGSVLTKSLNVFVTGQVLKVSIPENTGRAFVYYINTDTGEEKLARQRETNSDEHLEVIEVNIYEQKDDGSLELDTEGEPPPENPPQSSSNAISRLNITVVLPDQISGDEVENAKPPNAKKKIDEAEDNSAQSKSARQKKQSSNLEPAPSIIPSPVVRPGDNTTNDPSSPTDNPIVKTKDNTTPSVLKKPASVSDPTRRVRRVSQKELDRQRQIRTHGEISRKLKITKISEDERFNKERKIAYLSDTGEPIYFDNKPNPDITVKRTVSLKGYPVITKPTLDPDNDTNTDNDLRILPPGVVRTPKITTKTGYDPTPTPNPTKVNPCKKGCGGSSGSSTNPTSGAGNNTALLGGLNDLLIQNPLLLKIDATTTGTQSFMKKAWNFTQADKIINGLTLVTALHNAAQLSQNVAVSLGDTVTAALEGLNIKSPEGTPIDVNAAIGKQAKALLTSIFGASNLNAASEGWKKLNRIHQATASMVNSIQGTKNALLEADEITGGNVAKLANTLLNEGQVEPDAYEFMNEQPDYQTQFSGILGKINAIDEIGDRVSSVVSSGLEIKENINELKTNSDDLKKATDEFIAAKKTKENAKNIASASPTIDRLDLLKKEPES